MFIKANVSDLIKASSMTSYHQDKNYEMLELLGDSLLKYFMSIKNIYYTCICYNKFKYFL